jgi:hypothetical protein
VFFLIKSSADEAEDRQSKAVARQVLKVFDLYVAGVSRVERST